MPDEMPLGALIPFKSADEEDQHVYQTLFADHLEEMGVMVNPVSDHNEDQKGEIPRSDL